MAEKTKAKGGAKAAERAPAKVEGKKDGRGGARPGAGRKKNSGAFGERTTPMRIPESILPQVEAALEKLKAKASKAKEQGGRLAPASEPSKVILPQAPQTAKQAEQGRSGKPMDLGAALVKKPATSYVLRVSGSHLAAHGVLDGDYAVIDRSQKPADGSLVAVMIEGEMSLRALSLDASGAWLRPIGKAKAKAPAELKSLEIWGVASAVGRKL